MGNRPSSSGSTEERSLEKELKLEDRAERCGEGGLQVLDGLEERIRALALGWRVLPAEADAEESEATAQAGEEVVNGLERDDGLEVLNSLANGDIGQELDEDLPEHGGAESVTGQRLRKEDREGVATARALAAIRAVGPLSPEPRVVGCGGVVTEEEAVPV